MNDTGAMWARHRAELQRVMPEHVARLRWDRATIEDHQRTRLRELLRAAQAGSPFHARRLRGVDPGTFELDDVRRLPTMTKSTMMANLDDVLTDRRLTRDLIERHLDATGSDASFLLRDYTVLASGGISGERGVFVFGWEELVEYAGALLRTGVARSALIASAEVVEYQVRQTGDGIDVAAIERHPVTGKAKRFVTLALGGLARTR